MKSIGISELSLAARTVPESGIVEVVNYGRGRPGLVPLWVGEGDAPTPGFIVEAAERSLRAGETFYTWQRGLPELRAAIAAYIARLHGRPVADDRIFVTGSGMQAIQIAFRLVTEPGDEVIVPTPAWPNSAAAVSINGGRPVYAPMTPGPDGWRLDPAALEALVTPRSRALFVNSPANPTGWTASREDLSALLSIARRRGLWIVADEIYGRFVHTGAALAPSFHDVMTPEDRILFVQTFSKNWAMTGWRLGWLEAPAAFGQAIENLIQYSTSGSPVFVQRGALAAIEGGEPFVAEQVTRARRNRATLLEAFGGSNRVVMTPPDGAFYLFFAVRGERDARATAIDLVDRAGVGLAPGSAFGPGGASFLRLCYMRAEDQIALAAERIAGYLAEA